MAELTTRQRREARAARLTGWAATREQRATATLAADSALPYAHDIAFLTQPGRIPARTAMNRRADASYASLQKAAQMRSRARNITAAAGRAIYSDDANAITALRARIAGLEAERGRIVAYNKAVRSAGKVTAEALALLDDKQRADLKVLAQVGQLRDDGAFPAYATANISGNLSKQRQRLAELEAAAAARAAQRGPRSLAGTPRNAA